MLLIRSRSTGELVFATGSSRSPSPSPSSISCSGSASGVPGLHSTNFSPISDCGRMAQEASAFQGVKSSSSIRSVTAAFLSSVTSRSEITTHGDAGDLHVLALHERRGVVEDRAHEVGVLAVVVDGVRTTPITIHGTIATARAIQTIRLMGRAGSWCGLQPMNSRAALPSGAGWMSRAGQRVFCRFEAVEPLGGRDAGERRSPGRSWTG